MSKCKVITVCIICLALLLTVSFTTNAKPMANLGDGELVIKMPQKARPYTPTRDQEDPFWTYRFLVSADGGANWSDILNTGDTGMWMIDGEDTVSVYAGEFENFGAVVDGNNNLHFVAVLNGFTDYNPLDRVNGVYDIKVDAEGNAAYYLIAAEGEDQGFSWSDAGIDADGNLYAIWLNPVVPEEGDSYGELFAAKSTDGGENWSDPYAVSDELDAADAYPHMTSQVGEYFYVLHQMVGETAYDQYVIKVPAALEGESVNMAMAAEAGCGVYYSYYITAVDPIAQDVDAGWVYFCTRNLDMSGTSVTSTNDGGENWTTVTVAGAQRYPSIALGDDMPWVFSNYAVPGADVFTHEAWCAFDEGGYGGGSWTEQIDFMSVDYPGEVLYVAGGAWTSEGVLVGGCNIWAYGAGYTFTPYGYGLTTSEDGGENWSEMQHLWDIWETELQGGYVSHSHLMTGPDNHIWLAFGGRYGYTDIVPPEIATTDLSSVMLGEDKVMTIEVNDDVDIYYYPDYELWDVWVDLWKVTDDTLCLPMEGLSYDSADVNEDGIGTYYFHLEDSLEYFVNDTTTEKRVLEAGDRIEFYSYCWDGSGNLAIEHDGNWNNVWIVNESFSEVTENANVPFTFEVGQNYPNPFNNSTVIPFTLNREADVKVSIYDLSGRLIDTVFEARVSAGRHAVSWRGEEVSTGLYIYTVEAAGIRHVGKMTLLR